MSGHVGRRVSETDRRAQMISLTSTGQSEFRTMAAGTRNWIAELFGGFTRKIKRT